jgi:hypothetical protein
MHYSDFDQISDMPAATSVPMSASTTVGGTCHVEIFYCFQVWDDKSSRHSFWQMSICRYELPDDHPLLAEVRKVLSFWEALCVVWCYMINEHIWQHSLWENSRVCVQNIFRASKCSLCHWAWCRWTRGKLMILVSTSLLSGILVHL